MVGGVVGVGFWGRVGVAVRLGRGLAGKEIVDDGAQGEA